MTDEEIAVKLEGHEHEIKSLKHRMDDQEEQTKTLNDLVLSVKELAINMKNMITEQQKAAERINRLESEPADRYRHMRNTVIASILSVLAGALAAGLIVTAAQYVR